MPALIIQEKHASFGTYAEILEQVAAKAHIRCIEVEGDKHQYTDTVAIGKLINQ
ncbi:hypothetical protein [Photobacterium aquimaris]|uniref:hypothetical protein n=1 Tax=Photobacterium aquimaris TaxID=512643 RepID=UPI0013566B5E|nr:hypothetical protein [Photobacterium aquimaris]